jgi:hypothetical protein
MYLTPFKLYTLNLEAQTFSAKHETLSLKP